MEPLDPTALAYGLTVALLYYWLGYRAGVRNSAADDSCAEPDQAPPDPAESEQQCK